MFLSVKLANSCQNRKSEVANTDYGEMVSLFGLAAKL